MIYLLYGDNFVESRKKIKAILDSQLKKNPDASYFKINADTWNSDTLDEFIGTGGLFQSKYIVVLEDILSDKKIAGTALSRLNDCKESQNIFIFLELDLKKEIVSKVEKYAEKVQHFETKKILSKYKDEFNVFTLTDALGARDRKHLWVLYQKAILSKIDPEEIHRLFFWQVKAMISARSSSGATEAGLNPFVYKKSLGFSKNFSNEELAKLSRDLVVMYHDARRGVIDFDVALERFVLAV